MQSVKFFRTVWRANALLILFGGLLAVLLLAFIAFQISKETFGTRNVHAVVNTDQSEVDERLSLARGKLIRGSEHVLVALQSDQHYQQSYFSKSARAIRNYAFVGMSGQSAWVYPHNRFLFSDAVVVPSVVHGGEPQPARAVLFLVRKEDSDGDRRLTHRDAGVIALAKPNGEGFVEVLTDVTRIVSHHVMENTLFLVYESSHGPYAASISLQDFSVGMRSPLALPSLKDE